MRLKREVRNGIRLRLVTPAKRVVTVLHLARLIAEDILIR